MTRDLKRDAEMYDKHSVKSFNPLNPCLIAGKRDSEWFHFVWITDLIDYTDGTDFLPIKIMVMLMA